MPKYAVIQLNDDDDCTTIVKLSFCVSSGFHNISFSSDIAVGAELSRLRELAASGERVEEEPAARVLKQEPHLPPQPVHNLKEESEEASPSCSGVGVEAESSRSSAAPTDAILFNMIKEEAPDDVMIVQDVLEQPYVEEPVATTSSQPVPFLFPVKRLRPDHAFPHLQLVGHMDLATMLQGPSPSLETINVGKAKRPRKKAERQKRDPSTMQFIECAVCHKTIQKARSNYYHHSAIHLDESVPPAAECGACGYKSRRRESVETHCRTCKSGAGQLIVYPKTPEMRAHMRNALSRCFPTEYDFTYPASEQNTGEEGRMAVEQQEEQEEQRAVEQEQQVADENAEQQEHFQES